jgi:hypothetical protein
LTAKITIHLGGQEIRVFYLGPGQKSRRHVRPVSTRPCDLHAPRISKRSWAKHGVHALGRKLIALLNKVAALMDVSKVLPAHGDLATRIDMAADNSRIAAALV